MPHLSVLTVDDTCHVAADLIGNNKPAITTLRERGKGRRKHSGQARFRVNIFTQHQLDAPQSRPDVAGGAAAIADVNVLERRETERALTLC